MGAKSIIARYVERNRSALPSNQDELRQHLVAVASGASLKLTEKELNELAPVITEKKPKTGQIKDEAEKSGNDTSE